MDKSSTCTLLSNIICDKPELNYVSLYIVNFVNACSIELMLVTIIG